MIKKQVLYRAAAATVLGLSLTTGVAAAQTPYQYYSHRHRQVPTDNVLMASSVSNQNAVNAVNNTNQVTQSGDAVVAGNRRGGDAKTGGATASNSLNGTVNVNTPSGSGSSDTNADTADLPSSNSKVNSNTVVMSHVSNTNTVNVVNNTNQVTQSGDATVVHNRTGGSAATGDVTASNDSTFTISVND